jgi:hypothetical protein
LALASLILSLSLVDNAWAYLDPAAGWMIVQGLVAVVAAAGVAIGSYWSTLKTWFCRRKQTHAEEEPERPGLDKK